MSKAEHFTNREIRQMVDEIDTAGDNLTAWEIKFIADLIDRDAKDFTDNQKKQVVRIWNERMST